MMSSWLCTSHEFTVCFTQVRSRLMRGKKERQAGNAAMDDRDVRVKRRAKRGQVVREDYLQSW